MTGQLCLFTLIQVVVSSLVCNKVLQGMFVTPVYVQFISCCMFIEFWLSKFCWLSLCLHSLLKVGEESADFLMLIRMTFANDNV